MAARRSSEVCAEPGPPPVLAVRTDPSVLDGPLAEVPLLPDARAVDCASLDVPVDVLPGTPSAGARFAASLGPAPLGPALLLDEVPLCAEPLEPGLPLDELLFAEPLLPLELLLLELDDEDDDDDDGDGDGDGDEREDGTDGAPEVAQPAAASVTVTITSARETRAVKSDCPESRIRCPLTGPIARPPELSAQLPAAITFAGLLATADFSATDVFAFPVPPFAAFRTGVASVSSLPVKNVRS